MLMNIITSENKIPPLPSGELIIPEGVLQIDAFAYADEREITSVKLPTGLLKVGAHAFYNCRSLCKITLGRSDTDIGDGAFKNCERLNQIELVKDSESIRALKAILFDAHRQVTVKIIYPDGEALLIFPYFMDNFEENTPARIVMHVPEGAGAPYRECIYSGDVDYKTYDELFHTGINLDIYDCAGDIAICRLTSPYKLSAHAKEMYESFLRANVAAFFTRLIRENNTHSLQLLLSLDLTDRSLLSKMIDTAKENKRPEALAVLLAYYGEKFKGKRDRYEF